MAAIVTAEDIAMSYGNTPILKGVSFELEAGESLSLIGSNGAGKSTLIRCLSVSYTHLTLPTTVIV